jgi:class 3 adenylate cyclase
MARLSEPDNRPDSRMNEDAGAVRRQLDAALAREAAMGRILRVMARAPSDLQSILDTIAQSAARLCEARDALIMRVTETGIMPVATHGVIGKRLMERALELYPSEPGRMPVFPYDRGWVGGRAVLERRTVHVPDLATESPVEYPLGKASALSIGHRTSLSTPLLAEGRVIGVIGTYRDEVRPFTEEQIAQLEIFADQAVIALENARLVHDLQSRTAELAELNRTLAARVREQVQQLERAGRLRRYLAPQVAELILSSGDESALASHRRQITVLFCDLRGFTAFAETADPEEVMAVLDEYHRALGALIHGVEGTIERFAGDGLMVFFNDPLLQPDHAERAVRLAVAMRQQVATLAKRWRREGHELDFGVGIALGHATLGRIGFEGRLDYAAIGPVTNLAARLCAEATGGEILVSGRVHGAVEAIVTAEPRGELVLKGFHRPVAAFNVSGLRSQQSTVT